MVTRVLVREDHSRSFHHNLFLYMMISLKGSDTCTIMYALSSVTFYIERDTGIINSSYSYVIGINWNSPGRPKVKISLNQLLSTLGS